MAGPVSIDMAGLTRHRNDMRRLAQMLPREIRKALTQIAAVLEKNARKWARPGGAFKGGTGFLAARLFARLASDDTVELGARGVAYARIQDVGGTIKRHWVGPREANVTRGVSWLKSPRLAKGDRRRGRTNTRYGGVLSWVQGGVRYFSKGHYVGPSVIKPTRYSLKSWQKTEAFARKILTSIFTAVRGR